eukprot:TRINITY_DN4122_c0_g1_i1.p1 TRINITY_DN4122_c0_g1~~TRINITY_DN4122_c0_g1_i1.p1  ORF type:complete len:459 (+),score=78.23 TRINITY_DN4122_c0_g1_i1:70-1446(+)
MALRCYCLCGNIIVNLSGKISEKTKDEKLKWVGEMTHMKTFGLSVLGIAGIKKNVKELGNIRYLTVGNDNYECLRCSNCDVDVYLQEKGPITSAVIVNMELPTSSPDENDKNYSHAFRIILDPETTSMSKQKEKVPSHLKSVHNKLVQTFQQYKIDETILMEERIKAFEKREREELANREARAVADLRHIFHKIKAADTRTEEILSPRFAKHSFSDQINLLKMKMQPVSARRIAPSATSSPAVTALSKSVEIDLSPSPPSDSPQVRSTQPAESKDEAKPKKTEEPASKKTQKKKKPKTHTQKKVTTNTNNVDSAEPVEQDIPTKADDMEFEFGSFFETQTFDLASSDEEEMMEEIEIQERKIPERKHKRGFPAKGRYKGAKVVESLFGTSMPVNIPSRARANASTNSNTTGTASDSDSDDTFIAPHEYAQSLVPQNQIDQLFDVPQSVSCTRHRRIFI